MAINFALATAVLRNTAPPPAQAENTRIPRQIWYGREHPRSGNPGVPKTNIQPGPALLSFTARGNPNNNKPPSLSNTGYREYSCYSKGKLNIRSEYREHE